MKKIILFLLFFLPWFFSSLFIRDTSIYQILHLPSFAFKPIVFIIVWPILYFLIALSAYHVYSQFGFKQNKEYQHILFINYLLNQLYPLLFFRFHSLFLSFMDTVFLFISTLFLYYETKSFHKKYALYLIPYVIYSFYALVLSLSIYFLNL